MPTNQVRLDSPPRVVTLRLAKHRSVVPSVGLPTQYKTSLEGIGRTQQLTDGCLATSPATNFEDVKELVETIISDSWSFPALRP